MAKKSAPPKPPTLTKFLVTTSAFIAGVVIDEDIGIVIGADPGLKHFMGCSVKDFHKAVKANRWAMQQKD